MGQEGETAKRQKIFKNFQVNAKLYALAAKKAIVLHCLPMLKGWEITADIVEHANSAIFDQAANRLHAQKALMEGLFSPAATAKKTAVKVKTAKISKSAQRLVEKRV
jgi:ornithine carbamoyltransferase